jgi:hypothetical protein
VCQVHEQLSIYQVNHSGHLIAEKSTDLLCQAAAHIQHHVPQEFTCRRGERIISMPNATETSGLDTTGGPGCGIPLKSALDHINHSLDIIEQFHCRPPHIVFLIDPLSRLSQCSNL